MAINRDSKGVRVQEIADAFDSSINSADEQRAQGLDALQKIRAAKANGLQRDQARLERKLGPDSPRVAQLAGRIAINAVLIDNIATEASRARTEPVAPDKDAWILHGRVFDSHFHGLPNLTVALYDAHNTWRQDAGFACTDKSGYFKLRLVIVSGVTSGRAERVPESSMGRAGEAAGSLQPLYVHVLDAKSKTIFADKRGFTPTPNTTDYIEIVLGDTPAECAPPEESKKPKPKPAKG